MNSTWKAIVWQQFGAAIDMLENAMRECPDDLWRDRSKQPEYWYLVYHTLFWLDFYLSAPDEGFTPPAPFTLDEMDPAGLIPERPYTKKELQAYLEHGRKKCREAIGALTDARGNKRCQFGWGEASYSELLLYNMRHVQHHAAQLNLILRQQIDSAPRWVAKARTK
ncbi:MAG TPA: DinB family protein [Candidatus Eisenbacteria bacterium]|nr:DinB family protein [Candidatus Eisenbacteria bacterium]